MLSVLRFEGRQDAELAAPGTEEASITAAAPCTTEASTFSAPWAVGDFFDDEVVVSAGGGVPGKGGFRPCRAAGTTLQDTMLWGHSGQKFA